MRSIILITIFKVFFFSSNFKTKKKWLLQVVWRWRSWLPICSELAGDLAFPSSIFVSRNFLTTQRNELNLRRFSGSAMCRTFEAHSEICVKILIYPSISYLPLPLRINKYFHVCLGKNSCQKTISYRGWTIIGPVVISSKSNSAALYPNVVNV